MIAIIAAIAVISVIATIAVIAIIGTSVDAENAVLCTESAERKCRENNIQLSSCTDWSVVSGTPKHHAPGRVDPSSRARPAHQELVLVLSRLFWLKSARNPPARNPPFAQNGLGLGAGGWG